MAHVVFICPTEHVPVPTGIGMDRMSFENASMADNTFDCPACGKEHTWQEGKGILVDEGDSPPDSRR